MMVSKAANGETLNGIPHGDPVASECLSNLKEGGDTVYDVCVGDSFGKLEVISITVEPTKRKSPIALCECECGNFIEVKACRLIQKHKPVKSCGCLRVEAVHNSKTTHGESGGLVVGKRTKLYRTWSNIKSRCYNPKVRSYHDYGAKGIGMCDEWLHDFVAFRDWAIANGYSDNLTIDRIDVNGNYCPENCRWITSSENSILAHQKSGWGYCAETGERVEITNFKKFAEERGLSNKCIDRVLHKKQKQHKGWIFGYK